MITLALSVTLYCIVHSVTADPYIMGGLYKKHWYRFFYVFLSFFLLLPVVLVYLHTDKKEFFNPSLPVALLLSLIWFSALAFAIYAAKSYDNMSFLGISQLKDKNAEQQKKLTRKGALGIVRHPYYSASLVLIWARPMNNADFMITLLLTAYFILGTINEERKLIKEFGSEYREYMRDVPALIPSVRRKK